MAHGEHEIRFESLSFVVRPKRDHSDFISGNVNKCRASVSAIDVRVGIIALSAENEAVNIANRISNYLAISESVWKDVSRCSRNRVKNFVRDVSVSRAALGDVNWLVREPVLHIVVDAVSISSRSHSDDRALKKVVRVR